MRTLRPANERGLGDHGWLKSRFSFSFADYHDPDHMGFEHLRVINDDHIAAGRGFGMHPHRDMEIFSYIVDGELAHEDTLGHKATIQPGRVQLMGAGTGLMHSEFNPSQSNATHLLQIWLLPRTRRLPTAYQELDFTDADVRNRFHLLVAPDTAHVEGALGIRQEVRIFASRLDAGTALTVPTTVGTGWLQVVSGSLELDGQALVTGDGVAIKDDAVLNLRALAPSEVLWFDMF